MQRCELTFQTSLSCADHLSLPLCPPFFLALTPFQVRISLSFISLFLVSIQKNADVLGIFFASVCMSVCVCRNVHAYTREIMTDTIIISQVNVFVCMCVSVKVTSYECQLLEVNLCIIQEVIFIILNPRDS